MNLNLRIIGGALGMNTRYYIKGNQVYYRYNNLFRRKQRAIRQDEVDAAIKLRQNVTVAFVSAVVLVTICEAGYLFISSLGHAHNMSRVYSSPRVSVAANKVVDETEELYTSVKDDMEVQLEQIEAIITEELEVIEEYTVAEDPIDIEIEETKVEEVKEEGSIQQLATGQQYEVNDLVYRQYSNPLISDGIELIELDLPSDYYGDGIDFSSFFPFEDYKDITNTKSQGYKITRSENCYTDENGLRRYLLTEGEFSVDGKDDYVVALGTYYEPKGTLGTRFLVETTTGSFTIKTADKKSDLHTDDMNMFSTHGGGKYAGLLEFIVDKSNLDSDIKSAGTITKGSDIDEALKGEIIHIYEINDI